MEMIDFNLYTTLFEAILKLEYFHIKNKRLL